jgi:hypothetical protein
MLELPQHLLLDIKVNKHLHISYTSVKTQGEQHRTVIKCQVRSAGKMKKKARRALTVAHLTIGGVEPSGQVVSLGAVVSS